MRAVAHIRRVSSNPTTETAPDVAVNGARGELTALLSLAMPLFVTHLGAFMLGVVDIAIVGRLGEAPIAAVGLGHIAFFAASVLGFGWMLALDPQIAQAIGAGERDRARHLLAQGVWLATIGAFPLMLGLFLAGENLERFGIESDTAVQARPYLYARLPALLPYLWLAAARSFLQANSLTRPLVIGVIAANLVNAPLAYLFVFGAPGLSPMGTFGAGVAASIANVVQLAVAVIAVHMREPGGLSGPDRTAMIKTVRLGTPIGLALLAEVGSFVLVAVLMGNLGTRALATHNVAITLISATFQLALALGAAASVRVGQAIGRGDTRAARRAGLLAIVSIGVFMITAAIMFLAMPRALASILTDEPRVIAAAVPLLAVAAAFQLFDGVQAVAAGALRGAGDTRWPLGLNLIGHYAIGIPVGATLAFGVGLGAVGLWWGLSAGLTTVAIALTARFLSLSSRPIARV